MKIKPLVLAVLSQVVLPALVSMQSSTLAGIIGLLGLGGAALLAPAYLPTIAGIISAVASVGLIVVQQAEQDDDK